MLWGGSTAGGVLTWSVESLQRLLLVFGDALQDLEVQLLNKAAILILEVLDYLSQGVRFTLGALTFLALALSLVDHIRQLFHLRLEVRGRLVIARLQIG